MIGWVTIEIWRLSTLRSASGTYGGLPPIPFGPSPRSAPRPVRTRPGTFVQGWPLLGTLTGLPSTKVPANLRSRGSISVSVEPDIRRPGLLRTAAWDGHFAWAVVAADGDSASRRLDVKVRRL